MTNILLQREKKKPPRMQPPMDVASTSHQFMPMHNMARCNGDIVENGRVHVHPVCNHPFPSTNQSSENTLFPFFSFLLESKKKKTKKEREKKSCGQGVERNLLFLIAMIGEQYGVFLTTKDTSRFLDTDRIYYKCKFTLRRIAYTKSCPIEYSLVT